MKKIMIAAAVLAALTACNKTLIEGPMADSEYGYINLGVTADTEMEVTTKAGENTDNYLVTIRNSSSSVVTGYDNVLYSTIKNSEIKLPAGDYTVEVQNFKAEDLYDSPRTNGAVRVEGKASVTLAAGENKSVTVGCTPANAKVSVAYDSNFTTVFVNPSIKIKNSAKEFTMTWGHNDTNAVYYNKTKDNVSVMINSDDRLMSVAELTWEMTATVGGISKIYRGTFNAPVAYWTKVDLKAGDSGIITITVMTNESISDVYTVDKVIDPTSGTGN